MVKQAKKEFEEYTARSNRTNGKNVFKYIRNTTTEREEVGPSDDKV